MDEGGPFCGDKSLGACYTLHITRSELSVDLQDDFMKGGMFHLISQLSNYSKVV